MMKSECISDIGYYRKKNQDTCSMVRNKNNDLLVLVCDGIGGNKAGEVASLKTSSYFENIFKKNKGFKDNNEARIFLHFHIKEINSLIYKLASTNKDYEGMGTTLTGLLFLENNILVFNIGDSRCYGINDDGLVQLTQDDSLVATMLKAGQISKEESLKHPKRHYLTKAIGVFANIEPKINNVGNYHYYLVCSDGLHGYVKENKLFKTINDKKSSLAQKAISLRDASLKAGGYDNITLILVEDDQWK